MTKGDLKIGQIVYLEPYGNYSRYNKDVIEATIQKIGRIYFDVKGTIKNGIEEKFEIETLKMKQSEHSHNQGYSLYFTKQEILDNNEKEELKRKFRKFFDWNSAAANKLALEQLRSIDKIIAP
jgi:hypothetical protein